MKKKLNRRDVIGKSLRGLQIPQVEREKPCSLESNVHVYELDNVGCFQAIAVWLLYVNNKKWIAFGILGMKIEFTALTFQLPINGRFTSNAQRLLFKSSRDVTQPSKSSGNCQLIAQHFSKS